MYTVNNLTSETHGTSHFLVMNLINESDIEQLGLGMISNNEITGILNLSSTHFNDTHQLRYEITSCRKMTALLSDKVKWSFIIASLIEIVETLIEAEDYLLDAHQFVLNPEYIYYNVQHHIELIYLPMDNLDNDAFDVFKLTKYILNNVVIDEDQGVSVSAVLSYLNQDTQKSLHNFYNLLKGKPIEKASIVQSAVLSSKEKPVRQEKASVPVQSTCLIRLKTQEKIEINHDVFKIGNNPSKCHYSCLSNSAISRSHADIIHHKSEYYIVDNNSTNKTYLNGNALIPKKQYKLSHQDRIKLANEAFTIEIKS